MGIIKLSIVIVTYNRRNDLEECLNSLLNLSEPPSEIIVVDSNSNDGTHELVKRYPVEFVNIMERSMVKARNVGLQHAKGDVVAYIDDDVVVSKEWAKYILKPYENETVGGVGGRVVPSGHQETTISLPEKYRAIGKLFDNGFILNNYDIPTQNPTEVDTLIGCNMSFRRELLLKIGGFDENFMGSCFRDDTDVSTRVKKLKYRLIYHPKAVVWHKYKGKAVDRKWFYWYAYNHFYFCFKNLQPVSPWKFVRLLRGAFLPPLTYVRKANIKFRPDPSAFFYVVLGILDAGRTYKTSFHEANAHHSEKDEHSSDEHTQKWYFERWHEYQKKKDAIQWLYHDVLKWGAEKSGLNLLDGKNNVAVDVGSAHGYVAALLNKLGYTAYGCDLLKFYLTTYAKHMTSNLLVCDAQMLPFSENKIDLITAFEVLEHLPNYNEFLSRCYNSLKEGGALLITTPNAALKGLNLKFWRDYALGSLVLDNHNIDGHSHEFSSTMELKKNLERVGFSKVAVETWWFAPVPPTLFERYFVGKLPMYMIPHFRCVAVKA